MTATRKLCIGPLAILGVVSSIMISLPQSTEAFAPTSHATLVSGKSCTSIRSIFEDGKDEGGGGGIDFRNFNPLKQSAGNIANMPSFNTQISMRKVQMQEMTGELLNVVGNEDMTNQILNRFKDFLLQPLEDPDTILEADSIYTPEMSRKERYETYRASMDERIQNSKNGSVRAILQSMRDFVLSFEDE